MLLYTQFVQSLYNWAFNTKTALTIYLIFVFTIFIPILFSSLHFSFFFFFLKYSFITYLDGGDLMYQRMFLRICLTRTPGKLSGLYTVQRCIFSFCPPLPGSHEGTPCQLSGLYTVQGFYLFILPSPPRIARRCSPAGNKGQGSAIPWVMMSFIPPSI